MRLTRMTTRRWMIAGIAIGGFLGFMRASRHAQSLRRKAQGYAFQAEVCRIRAKSKLKAALDHEAYGGERMLQVAAGYRAEAKMRMKNAEILDRLSRKYDRAATYPWRPIEPDPPWPTAQTVMSE